MEETIASILGDILIIGGVTILAALLFFIWFDGGDI